MPPTFDPDYAPPGPFRRFKNWLFGEKEPELSFQPDRETILLARDLLLARRARMGFLSAWFVPARNRYELVRTVRDVCERTGVHEDEAIGWLGITRARFAEWSADFPRLERRFEREEEIREKWAELIFQPVFTVGFIAGALALIVLSFFFLDRPAAEYFNQFDQKSAGMRMWVHITFAGDATLFYLFTIFGILLTWTRDRQTARALIFFLFCLFIPGLVVWISKLSLGRPRPELFLNDGLWGFFQFSFDNVNAAYKKLSFPSGHGTHSAAVGVSLALLFPRLRYLFLLYPLLVGISRVVLVQHYPSDILGGWTIGTLIALWVFHRMYPDGYAAPPSPPA